MKKYLIGLVMLLAGCAVKSGEDSGDITVKAGLSSQDEAFCYWRLDFPGKSKDDLSTYVFIRSIYKNSDSNSVSDVGPFGNIKCYDNYIIVSSSINLNVCNDPNIYGTYMK